MNSKTAFALGVAIFLLLSSSGMLWADLATDCEPWNRPQYVPPPGMETVTQGMDYVSQELGFYDTLYPEYDEAGCRACHGATLSDRHHCSDQGPQCTYCHLLDPNEPSGVQIEHNCLAPGCHQWPTDIPNNGWHHNTDLDGAKNCVSCHNPNLVDEIDDFWDHQTYPPKVVTPTPFDCENCHWSQQISSDHHLNDATMLPATPGHPSTYDHYDLSGDLTGVGPGGVPAPGWGFYEYEMPLHTNAKTHHMEEVGFVLNTCDRCHSQDPNSLQIDPFDPEYIRYCIICHSIPSLHRIGTHGQKHSGWRPVGFHLPQGGSGAAYENCADVDPTEYRTGDIDEPGAHPYDGNVVGIYDNLWPDMDTSDNAFMYHPAYPCPQQQPGYYWGQVPEGQKWYNPIPDPENLTPTDAENWASGSDGANMPDYYNQVDQCNGCHRGDPNEFDLWNFWPCRSPGTPYVGHMAPLAGSCSIHVTLEGEWFGPDHTTDRGVVLWDGTGSPEPIAAGGNGVNMPIHAWTNTLIEFEISCWDSNLTPGNYYVAIWYLDDYGEYRFSPMTKVFSIKDQCTSMTVNPTSSSCATWLTVLGCGDIDTARSVPPSVFDPYESYHGRLTVVDFVGQSGTYTATQFRNWSSQGFEVAVTDFFEDQADTCGENPIFYDVDMRNFVQDDSSAIPSGPCAGHLCPWEPTIPGCDSMVDGCYNIYVKNIYYGDEDGSDSLTCGDTIFLVGERDPLQWCLTPEPYLYQLAPRNIECSYLDQTGGTGIHWRVLRLFGGNLGSEQGNSSVVVGPYSWWASNPLGSYFEQPYVIWSNDLIKVGFVLPVPWEKYLPPAAAQGRTGAVWVRKDSQYTDPLPLFVEYCDIIR